jgi:hypothetical protein
MQKNPIYELSSTFGVSSDHNQRSVYAKLTIETVDLMLICKCCQVGNEEQIEEELDIGRLFVMLELGIVEQRLVMSVNWCFFWVRTLLRLPLVFFRTVANMCN